VNARPARTARRSRGSSPEGLHQLARRELATAGVGDRLHLLREVDLQSRGRSMWWSTCMRYATPPFPDCEFTRMIAS
jgi:hypothetical protein